VVAELRGELADRAETREGAALAQDLRGVRPRRQQPLELLGSFAVLSCGAVAAPAPTSAERSRRRTDPTASTANTTANRTMR
jgi:hypothetical protein